MNKIIISAIVLLGFASCKGPGAGPLVKESSDKSAHGMDMPVHDMGEHGMTGKSTGSKVAVEKINVKIEPCKDCVTISALLADKKTYSGKTIRITGQVTKFNAGIMGKNWIHIQDGTEFEGGFDLVITTDQTAAIGQTMTFEGKIVLDKDFGYGYFYAVLMEEAKALSTI